MMRALLLGLIFASNGLIAQAEEVVAALSQNQISITTNFSGSEILIFGAVKREERIANGDLHVVIAVSGPLEPVTVRRKARRFGIWVNTDTVEVDAAPSFYAVSTTGPFDQALSDTEDLRQSVSIPRAIRLVGAPSTVTDAQAFREALIRIRKSKNLYQLNEGQVEFDDNTLFQTRVRLPANLVEGSYKTRIFLTRDGTTVSAYETAIDVTKVGLERILYSMAHNQPLIYGLMSLAIAIAAGWGASAVFRVFQR
ncbi:MAG: TIGR02186 family protein [Pseudomonadota bacterium]